MLVDFQMLDCGDEAALLYHVVVHYLHEVLIHPPHRAEHVVACQHGDDVDGHDQ